MLKAVITLWLATILLEKGDIPNKELTCAQTLRNVGQVNSQQITSYTSAPTLRNVSRLGEKDGCTN